jgi:Fungal Zn(2)-Cys(6) binuclear cluster domain/Fungal specific transcription factor domain
MSKKPSPKACLACRNKHVKCDGRIPVCTRCSSTGADCTYVESRRGYRGPKRKHLEQPPIGQTATSEGSDFTFDLIQSLQVPLPPATLSFTDDTISIDRESSDDDEGTYLIDLYYQFFHPAHPIVIPRRIYLQDYGIIPKHLSKAMRVIGCHFTTMNPEPYLKEAKEILDSKVPDDAFKVQSLLILAIGSFARFEREGGGNLLTQAVNVAQKIGLNDVNYGLGEQALLKESYRRTWWELYTIVGIVSLIMPFGLKLDTAWNLPLPCHCEEYNNGQPSQTKTLQDMQHRFLVEGSFLWSSFSYKVEAARILKNIIDLSSDPLTSQSQVDAAEISIASFWMDLPASKRDVISRSGKTDEVLFCAHMLISLGSVCLQLPRSGMQNIRHFKTSCWTDRARTVDENTASHKAAAIKAASRLTRLMSIGDSIKTHTPCFACAIAFATAVQLPAYMEENETSEVQMLKEQIQLAISTLRQIGETWPIANVVRAQVAQYAREIIGKPMLSVNRPLILESVPTSTDPMVGNQEWLQELLQGSQMEDFIL